MGCCLAGIANSEDFLCKIISCLTVNILALCWGEGGETSSMARATLLLAVSASGVGKKKILIALKTLNNLLLDALVLISFTPKCYSDITSNNILIVEKGTCTMWTYSFHKICPQLTVRALKQDSKKMTK